MLDLGWLALILFIGIVLLFLLFWLYSLLTANPPSRTEETLPPTVTFTLTRLGSQGDMGNQLFQLATAYAASLDSQARLVLPTKALTLPLHELFELNFTYQDLEITGIYREMSNYDSLAPSQAGVYDIRGYRQNYRYFDEHRSEIQALFRPKLTLLQKVREKLPSKYIAVHIRRGDYYKLIHSFELFKEFIHCDLTYYQAGIEHLREVLQDQECPVLVSTDDRDWLFPHLSQLDAYATLAPLVEGVSPKFSDFLSLYASDGIVIANSTYSWWAAYLRDRPTVAPSAWWEPGSFIGSTLALHGPFLQCPSWKTLNPRAGVTEPPPLDRSEQVPEVFQVIRGFFVS